MPRTYTVLSANPHPANPENILVRVQVLDDETGEKMVMETFAHDLTPEYLAKWVGIKEANVLSSRKDVIANLKAIEGQEIVPVAPVDETNPLQVAYFNAIRELQEVTELVRLGVLDDKGLEHQSAIQAAKDAHAALKG